MVTLWRMWHVVGTGRWKRLNVATRLLIAAAGCILVLAGSVLVAVAYAAHQIDAAAIDTEISRARGAVSRLVADGGAFTPAAVDRLGRDLGLSDFRLVDAQAVQQGSATLPVPDSPGAFFAWEPRRLGTEMITALAPLRLVTGGVFLAALGFAFFKLYRLAQELEARRQAAHELARRDGLTGLANRLGFDEAMAAALASEEPLGVVTLDLDDFKRVNDTKGHGAGDEVLRIIAARLGARRIEGDCAARTGGDEFAMLRRRIVGVAQLEELVADLSLALAEPIIIGTTEYRVNSSFGLALAPADGRDADTLMRVADAALYRAKRDSRSIRLPRRDLSTRAR